MPLPASLNIALKEWAAVIRALEAGVQIILLRKGGILEQGTGRQFQMIHSQFVFFPTYLHQGRGEIKLNVEFESVSAEPEQVRITAAAMVTDVIKVESRDQIDRLEADHIWTSKLIDMRFNYKPQNPLYLVLVRAYRLHAPVELQNSPAYAGCKSWVPLNEPLSTADAHPVLDDVKYEQARRMILEKLELR
jgi:hypothetical protein